MKTQKILIGGLVAGVVMFFLGWLIYGILLSGFMDSNCDSSGARPMDQMVWWALIASNLVWGLLLAILLDWSGSSTLGSAAKVGAVLGVLTGLGFDLGMYAMTTYFLSFSPIVIDAIAYGLMFAITGAITIMVMNKTGKA